MWAVLADAEEEGGIVLSDEGGGRRRPVVSSAMSSRAPWSVLRAVRLAVHLLVIALAALVAIRAPLAPGVGAARPAATIGLALVLVAVYLCGALEIRPRGDARPGGSGPSGRAVGWLLVLGALWLALLALSRDAAYLAFPLFFLELHLLRRWTGVLAVVVTAVAAALAGIIAEGWSLGALLGPLIGAAVAVIIALAVQALAAEAAQRERLLTELLRTQERLAVTERAAGVIDERARIAREMHDTVAQSLSSIQMLLHAAERADPGSAGIEHVRLARTSAADSLAETRRFIAALTPPPLEETDLASALGRLARTQWSVRGLAVDVRASDGLELPMALQSALLRICQGAIANVIQHSGASRAVIDLRADARSVALEIRDDGRGFVPRGDGLPQGRSDSFGLRAIAERTAQMGGTLDLRSQPGEGTRLRVEIPREETP